MASEKRLKEELHEALEETRKKEEELNIAMKRAAGEGNKSCSIENLNKRQTVVIHDLNCI